MKRLVQSGLMVASMSLMLSVPAFANTPANGMTGANVNRTTTGYHVNGTYTNGVATGVRDVTYGVANGVRDVTNGIANGVQDVTNGVTNGVRDVTNGTNVRDGNYTGYRTSSVNNGRYRTTATTNRNYNWGWLGLLGLIGLAGMRSRNPERER